MNTAWVWQALLTQGTLPAIVTPAIQRKEMSLVLLPNTFAVDANSTPGRLFLPPRFFLFLNQEQYKPENWVQTVKLLRTELLVPLLINKSTQRRGSTVGECIY